MPRPPTPPPTRRLGRVTVFTSNQPRHIALLESLAAIATEVYGVLECNTVHPGQVDDFFRKSDVMQRYFARVIAAERTVFGQPRFPPANCRTLPLRMGDLSRLDPAILTDALAADAIIVFGASYIRPPLIGPLVERGAINIHMGIAPQYRGSSTNFWAMYDGRPDLVGATIHRLTAGLDSGPILFHTRPTPAAVDPFVFGMQAVQCAHHALTTALANGSLHHLPTTPQDATQQLRYTRNADFTDAVAGEYLARAPTPAELLALLKNGDSPAPSAGGLRMIRSVNL